MVILIDNYDSFSYNVYQLIAGIRPDVRVYRNDALTVKEIANLAPEAVFISPGPGRPEDTGVCFDVIRNLGSRVPIFGICIGLQAIVTAYGGVVTYAPKLMHGKASMITYDKESPLFRGMPNPFRAGRYHSLAADPEKIPGCLRVTARADDGQVMAVEHRTYPVAGVQFHPESILTPDGATIIRNFLSMAEKYPHA